MRILGYVFLALVAFIVATVAAARAGFLPAD